MVRIFASHCGSLPLPPSRERSGFDSPFRKQYYLSNLLLGLFLDPSLFFFPFVSSIAPDAAALFSSDPAAQKGTTDAGRRSCKCDQHSQTSLVGPALVVERATRDAYFRP